MNPDLAPLLTIIGVVLVGWGVLGLISWILDRVMSSNDDPYDF